MRDEDEKCNYKSAYHLLPYSLGIHGMSQIKGGQQISIPEKSLNPWEYRMSLYRSIAVLLKLQCNTQKLWQN